MGENLRRTSTRPNRDAKQMPHGFFIRGGVGPSFMDDDTDDGHAIGELGISALASAGYDFPLGRRFALTPAVSYRFDRVNDVMLDDGISLRDRSCSSSPVSAGAAHCQTAPLNLMASFAEVSLPVTVR